MSLTVLTDGLKTNHRRVLLQLAEKWQQQGKVTNIFVVVPNHIKFSEEVAILKELGQLTTRETMATTQLQTFSFSRLAWYFLKNTAYFGAKVFSETAQPLLIQKVLQDNLEQLVLLKTQAQGRGFVEQLQQLFQEFQQGVYCANSAEQMRQLQQLSGASFEKLKEFQLLYEAYCQELAKFSFRETSILQALTQYFMENPPQQTGFIFYGFEQFNLEEQQLLHQILLSDAPILLDAPYPSDSLEMFDWQKMDRDSLLAFCQQNDVPYTVQSLGTPQAFTPGEKLAATFRETFTQTTTPKADPNVEEYFQLYQAANPYEEVVGVAKTIQRLIRQKKYRYQDFTVYVRDTAQYQELLPRVFALNEIPYNLALSRTMKDHPFVEFLQSLFAILQRNYRTHDVLRLLKTELLPLTIKEELPFHELTFRQQVDIFENILLKNGFTGRDFTQGPWELLSLPQADSAGLLADPRYQKEQDLADFSNGLREALAGQLQPLQQALKKARNGREQALALLDFLVTSGVKNQLQQFRKEALDAGDLSLAKVHQQTWQAFCQLLEDYVTIYGEADVSLSSFQENMAVGLETITYEQIPQTLDQVQIEIFENVLPNANKVIFGLGLSEDNLPQKILNKTLLTDEERQTINQELQEASPLRFDSRKENQKENFRFHQFLLSGADYLYASFALQQEKGTTHFSPLILRLQNLFKLPLGLWQGVRGAESDQQTLGRLGNYRQLLREYPALWRLSQEQVLHPFWQTVPQLLRHSPLALIFSRLEEQLLRKNIPQALTPALATELYGEKIVASVSKMESFYDCQYQYFLNYGLRLKERETLALNPQVTGEFFHEALDTLFKILWQQEKNLAELTASQLQQFLRETLDLVLQEKHYQIFNRSARMLFIKDKLVAILTQLVQAMNQQQGQTHARSLSTEWRFDALQKNGLKGLQLPMSNGESLYLRGIIDRVDVTYVDQIPYLTVVDYKSSAHEFNFADAYYGLAMQMLSYLGVVLAEENQSYLQRQLVKAGHAEIPQPFKAGGALYLHVKNPEIKAPNPQVDLERLKAYKYRGLLVNEPDLLTELAPDLAGKSLIYPISQTAKELKVDNPQSVTPDELSLLLAKNQENLTAAGESIVSGKIALNPSYHDKERIACTYCPFRSICRFDVLLPENNYREIKKLAKEDVLKQIQEEKDHGDSTKAQQ